MAVSCCFCWGLELFDSFWIFLDSLQLRVLFFSENHRQFIEEIDPTLLDFMDALKSADSLRVVVARNAEELARTARSPALDVRVFAGAVGDGRTA